MTGTNYQSQCQAIEKTCPFCVEASVGASVDVRQRDDFQYERSRCRDAKIVDISEKKEER